MVESFAQFEARLKAQGFAEVLERSWQPGQLVGTHSHPFDANAVVVQGEMWLTVGDATQHIPAGGTFELARDTPHSERYGSEGATYWVGRRQ
jgi:quercetin dioxygenase-like cupin family protein